MAREGGWEMMGNQLEQVVDAMLVLRCQAGDSAAFEQIAGRWQGRLVLHAARLQIGRAHV